MEGFCRGCLIKYDDPTKLLQYTEKNRRLFVYSTSLQVKCNDAFTFSLCKDCYVNMKASCKFKKQCRSSDKRLKSYLALKDVGDSMDFGTFLRNNDDISTFRFPMLSGNSTPANQKIRDDDNESTCTSIRNFMSDILQGEEVPDTEARIIREVIEEEADVLEDSLDSHWLEDDISIDTDFALDLGYSPFATPRSVNEDHCYTPKRTDPSEEYKQLNYLTSKNILQNAEDLKNEHVEYIDNEPTKLLPIENANHTEYENGITLVDKDNLDEVDLKEDSDLIEYVDLIDSTDLQGKNALNYYIEDISIINETVLNDDIKQDDNVTIQNNKCSIDKNLEEALKNDTNQLFSLEELLLSPPVFPNVSAPSTPTITNILFGDKIDNVSENSTTGQHIEQYDNVEGDVDILEEFFQNETANLVDDDSIKNEPDVFIDKDELDKTEDTKYKDIYDLETLFCFACNKQLRTSKALKRHLTSKHKIILERTTNDSTKVCVECGKTFGGRANFHRHMKTHKKTTPKPVEIFKCDYCSLEFVSLNILNLHKKSHTGTYVGKDTGRKYVCTICNSVSTTPSNFRLHQRRHTKSYSHFCNQCDKGFYTAFALKNHVKSHKDTGPFKCTHCSIECNTLAKLNMHMKSHGGTSVKKESANKYVCTTCGIVSTTLGNFIRHQRRHTKSYTHHCEECGKGFYDKTSMNNHMTRHTGARPFKCVYCDRNFSLRYSLINHLKRHTDETRFHCDYCKNSFVRKASLIMHLRMSKLCFENRTSMPFDTKVEGDICFEYSPKADVENNIQYLNDIEEQLNGML